MSTTRTPVDLFRVVRPADKYVVIYGEVDTRTYMTDSRTVKANVHGIVPAKEASYPSFEETDAFFLTTAAGIGSFGTSAPGDGECWVGVASLDRVPVEATRDRQLLYWSTAPDEAVDTAAAPFDVAHWTGKAEVPPTRDGSTTLHAAFVYRLAGGCDLPGGYTLERRGDEQFVIRAPPPGHPNHIAPRRENLVGPRSSWRDFTLHARISDLDWQYVGMLFRASGIEEDFDYEPIRRYFGLRPELARVSEEEELPLIRYYLDRCSNGFSTARQHWMALHYAAYLKRSNCALTAPMIDEIHELMLRVEDMVEAEEVGLVLDLVRDALPRLRKLAAEAPPASSLTGIGGAPSPAADGTPAPRR